MKEYINLKDIIIPAGTKFITLPSGSKSSWNCDHIETTIGFSNDSTGTLIVDPQTLEDRKYLFTDIK